METLVGYLADLKLQMWLLRRNSIEKYAILGRPTKTVCAIIVLFATILWIKSGEFIKSTRTSDCNRCFAVPAIVSKPAHGKRRIERTP